MTTTASDEEAALTLYRTLRADGEAISEAELRKAAGLDADSAGRGLRRLRRLGLVRETASLLEPVEPDAALVRTMAAYQAQAAEQVRGATELQQLTDSLLTVYRPEVAREASYVEVEYFVGQRNKIRMTAMLNTTTQRSIDSMHPGPMATMDVLEGSLQMDAAMIGRGIKLRCLYSQSVLQGTRHAAYFRELNGIGAEVRIIDHAPCDLLIQDGVTVCLMSDPEDPSNQPALLIRGAALVRTLNAIYEDYWLRAIPYEQATTPEPGSRQAELTVQERVVIRLMAAGLTDDQIAHRMRISRRTVQRAVTKLMERLHTTNRFEAGLKFAQNPRFLRQLGRER